LLNSFGHIISLKGFEDESDQLLKEFKAKVPVDHLTAFRLIRLDDIQGHGRVVPLPTVVDVGLNEQEVLGCDVWVVDVD
jgi:hypothetical protein